MNRDRRTWAAIGAGCASGLLLAAAAPTGLAAWIAWVALAPAAAAALAWRGTRPGRLAIPVAFGLYLELQLVPALPFGLASGQWGDPPPVLVGDSPVLFVALLAVPAFGALLYAIRFGEPWFADRMPRPFGEVAAVLIPAAAFAALDFVRVQIDPGGLWGPLFLSQHGEGAAALAALGGPWLLSFAVAAAGYATALGALALGRAAAGGEPGGAPFAVAGGTAILILVAVAVGMGVEREGGRTLPVAVIQPGYDTAEEDRPQTRYFEPGSYDLAALDLIRDLAPLTHRAARSGARLVVWPEAAVWVDPASEPRVRGALARLARRSGAAILVPYFLRDRSQGAALAVLPNGSLTAAQAKQRPMWFLGEDGGNRRSPEPVTAAGARLGSLLGVDSQDPGVAREFADAGAELIASATHDWEQLAPQQQAFAALAARATGTPVARADWRYGSEIYGPDGAVLASAGDELERTVLVAEVGLSDGPTPYVGLGDALGWAFALASVAAASAALLARRLGSPVPAPGPETAG